MKNFQKGFTLIELLVVIAIIGILSSIVLASLSSARSKGTDAAIQSSISNLRAQGELYYSTYGDYATTSSYCSGADNTSIFNSTATGGMKTLMASIIKSANGQVSCVSSSSPALWAAAAKTSTGAVCADSAGNSKATPGAASATSTITNGACN